MGFRNSVCMRMLVVMTTLTLGILAGCAAKKWVVVEEPTGLVLEYRMVEGDVLRYETTQHSDQAMEPMGMVMETTAQKSYKFSVAPKGRDGDTYDLDITIDSMDAGVTSAQGEFSADVDSVIGKTFRMTLSRLGKELDVSDAEPIRYGIGPQGMQSIMSDFMALFPDLPGMPVNIGDSWTSQDSLTIAQNGMDVTIKTESVNTLAGVETFAGLACAKVASEVSGIVRGVGERQGAHIDFDGTITGTETWYFAHEVGLFVEISSDIFTKSTIAVSGPQEMSFPMTEKMRLTTALIQ